MDYILKQTGLRKLIVMPAFTPPHKLNEKVVSFRHRFAMLRLLLEEFGAPELSRIKLSTLEKRLPVPSYTFHTLSSLKKLCPGHTIGIVLGEDMYDTLPSWHSYQALIKQYSFIVFKRMLRAPPKTADLQVINRANVSFLDNPLWDHSASEIRQLLGDRSLRKDKTIRKQLNSMLPLGILNYILKYNLY